ncbi:hypothetical protein EWM64_g5937, partial [Hericium alpestre]
VRYLVMKAKHRFVLEQHHALIEELRVLRAAESEMREMKDSALDEVMRMEIGPQADPLIAPLAVVHQFNQYQPQGYYPPEAYR